MIGKQAQRFQLDRLETPIGTALLVTDDEGFLRALDWSDYEERLHHLLRRHYGDYALDKVPAPKEITSALTGYFAGDLDDLKRSNGGPTAHRSSARYGAGYRRSVRAGRRAMGRLPGG
jgi:methylated-DNA-[protein]-cysteine S-methyltransferase